MEMTGQKKKKKSRKLPLHKQPKLPIVDTTHSELTCVLLQKVSCCFHTHFAASTCIMLLMNHPSPFFPSQS